MSKNRVTGSGGGDFVKKRGHQRGAEMGTSRRAWRGRVGSSWFRGAAGLRELVRQRKTADAADHYGQENRDIHRGEGRRFRGQTARGQSKKKQPPYETPAGK